MGIEREEGLEGEFLTVDHKPDMPLEQQRIIVSSMLDGLSPYFMIDLVINFSSLCLSLILSLPAISIFGVYIYVHIYMYISIYLSIYACLLLLC